MALTYYVTSRSNKRIKLVAAEDDVQSVRLDFSGWAEDNAAVTTATWSVESGSATVSSAALNANVASALITTASLGSSLIKITATDGTRTKVVWICVKAFDPVLPSRNYDYGYLV